MDFSVEDIITLLAAVVSLILAIGAWRTSKSTSDNQTALAASTIQKAAVGLLDPLRDRVKEVEDRLEEVKKEHEKTKKESATVRAELEKNKVSFRKLSGKVRKLLFGIDALILQLQGLGAVPVWTPDETRS